VSEAPSTSTTTWGDKLKRLWQPKHPAFWTMLALNAASTAMMWLSQAYPLSTPARLVVLGFAIGNFWLGIRCAKVLIQSAPAD
jgi:hypothetical protein